jgi:DNA-binding response OmpR family regulator
VATVLVVDDDPVILNLLQASFEMEGWEVLTAGDGEEGLEVARANHPDAVVSDVMMPRLDGIGLAAAMKADPVLRAIPVVLLSAKAQVADVDAGLEVADAYVTKPFDPLDLLDRVAALIG